MASVWARAGRPTIIRRGVIKIFSYRFCAVSCYGITVGESNWKVFFYCTNYFTVRTLISIKVQVLTRCWTAPYSAHAPYRTAIYFARIVLMIGALGKRISKCRLHTLVMPINWGFCKNKINPTNQLTVICVLSNVCLCAFRDYRANQITSKIIFGDRQVRYT